MTDRQANKLLKLALLIPIILILSLVSLNLFSDHLVLQPSGFLGHDNDPFRYKFLWLTVSTQHYQIFNIISSVCLSIVIIMIINLSTSNTIQRKILLLTMIPALLKYIFIATIKKRFGWLINIDNNQLLDIIFWFDMVYLAYIQIWFLIKRNYFNKKIFLPIIILLISYALSWTYGAISCNMVYPGGMFCHLGELQYLMPMVILVAINIIWTIIILIKAKQKTA